MPLDVGEAINSFADAILRAPLINTIVHNPIYTAMIITTIVVLIVMFIFRDANTDESLLVLCLRSGFWIFLMMLGVLFLHNKVLITENESHSKDAAFEIVFNGGYARDIALGKPVSAVLEDSVVPVHINTDFS